MLHIIADSQVHSVILRRLCSVEECLKMVALFLPTIAQDYLTNESFLFLLNVCEHFEN
jgi:hypothetical protein